ncbi:MAG: 3-hydroxyacyl-CoA dehydrogenase/enoyl-CoA hydratase family protein [Halobacteriota archaeon]
MVVELADVERIAVLGAGNMGHGIAEVAALTGYDVVMRDIERDLVDDGYEDIEWSVEKLAEKGIVEEDPATVMARIETTTDLAAAVTDADVVVEAAPERLDVKRDIFADLDELTDDEAILATNTSSISITQIAAATDRPERVVGMHFFNPPVKMDLVEVIYGAETADETAETTYDLVEAMGKTPIYVRKDVNGFVVNSVLGPYVDEPAWMVSDGAATIREADATMVHERGYPMGPFELSDLTGIDVGYHVRNEAGRPIAPIVQEKVDAGDLGRKTGRGYYEYEGGDGANYTVDDAGDFDHLRVEARMVNEAAKLVGGGVATPDAVDTGMRLGTGFPEGPCRRGDDIGLETILEKLQTLHEETGEERFEPAPYLVGLVQSGHTGTTAGRGFYDYGSSADGPGEYQAIDYQLSDDGLLEIELDRPERLNALNDAMTESIVDLLESVDEDAVRAVVFRGAGDRAFCAGADITGFGDIQPATYAEPTEVFTAVDAFPAPTVAAIDGYCLGGGLELALACDLRVATDDSTFGFPEIDLGLLPGGGGTQRAMRILGEGRAKELVFRGTQIDAERAADWGLINRAVAPEAFEGVVDEYVDDLLSGPPIALRRAKRVMNEGADENLDAGLEMESQAFSLLLTTDDFVTGAAAFSEDRDPEFEGS